MNNDPYAALGVEKSATADEIRKAYRKIARTSHPDLNPGDAEAEERFKEAAAAFDLLKDPETRGRFDRGEIDASGAERQQRQYYRDFAEDAENPYRSSSGYSSYGDAEDIFGSFFRQQQARGGAQDHGFQARGADRQYSLQVSFLDAVNGGETRITLPDGGDLLVKIPMATADGQTIRLRGKGGPGFGGGPSGDALITVSVLPHPVFRREGDDIVITLPISIDEAVLGAKVATPTIDGPVQVTVPKGASGGQTLRLRGRGVKSRDGSKSGDQRVELRIVLPPEIDGDLADFMEKWAETNSYDPRKGMEA